MLTAEKAGKSCVTTDKALESISASSEKVFNETMQNQALPEGGDMTLVDVTHTMFQKPETKELPKSQFCIYKGIMANLVSWGRNDSGGKLCGLMAGDGTTVSDVIISMDFGTSIASDIVSNRWEDLDIKPMGLAVWMTEPQHSVEHLVPKLRELKSPFETLVLVILCGGQDPVVWDVAIPKEGVVTYCQCDGVKAQSGKKKGDSYRVVDFNALGHTTTSNMVSTLSALLKKNIKQKVADKLKRSSSSAGTSSLSEQSTPADGLCFWHSVLGTLDYDNWVAVPRKDSGYAINPRSVKHEEDTARQLMEAVMERATENGVDPTVITEIKRTGCVNVEDLPWVSKALNMKIRCTIDDEVGSCT